MRSRLEATVAAWLDHHEIAWTYEGPAYGDEADQYLGDFRLDDLFVTETGASARPMFVEVKPPRYDGVDVRERMQVIWSSIPDAVLAVWPGGRLQPTLGGFPLAVGAGNGTGAWRRGGAGLCSACHRLVVHFFSDPAHCRCGWSGEPDMLVGVDTGAELVDLDAEAALLGSLIFDPGLRADVGASVKVEHFASPVHGLIFETLMRQPENAAMEDLRVQLQRQGAVGAVDALARLGQGLSGSRTEQLAVQIRGWATLRALREAGVQMMELAATGSPAKVEDTVGAARALLDIFDVPVVRGRTTRAEEALTTFLDGLEQRYAQGPAFAGLKTGYIDLDELLGGLHPGMLYVVGARPSVGKSAFALGMATHVAVHQQRPVLYASLEMSSAELTHRLVCAEARIDSARVRTGRLADEDWARISQAIGRLAAAPLTLGDDPGMTVAGLRRLARDTKRRYGDLGLVVVDYLQLLGSRATAENRQVEVAEMSRGLKLLAGDLEVPVVACSQLSRQLELRADKRPMLSDLRESGAIENDADVVVFLYRDDLYHADSPDRGQAEILVAKHRSGPTGVSRLAFLEQFARFANMAKLD